MFRKIKSATSLVAVVMVLGSFAAASPSFAQSAGSAGGQGSQGGQNGSGGGESPVALGVFTHVPTHNPRPKRIRHEKESCSRHYGYNQVAQSYIGSDGMMHFCQVR